MSKEDTDDLLDCLLSVAKDEIHGETVGNLDEGNTSNACKSVLVEDQNFLKSCVNIEVTGKKHKSRRSLSSVIHSGHTDSSDDEQNRNCEASKYNEYGNSIKYLLETSAPQTVINFSGDKTTWKTKSEKIHALQLRKKTIAAVATDVYTDPVFGIRISKPLISSSVLLERMEGRDAVQISRIKAYLQKSNLDRDWVIAGVIVQKSATRTSQKGSNFCIWTLSDLKENLKTISLFLFGNVYKDLWKTVVGTVIGILNPSILDSKDGTKNEACLSVDNSQKVMVFGISKDLGTCRSKKKNGEECTAFVNVNSCAYCIYHVKEAYKNCSKRSELQSSFGGRGLTALRNKVLGKNEVFYAGKSYSAIPATKSKKHVAKDKGRLESLMGSNINSKSAVKSKNVNKNRHAAMLEISKGQRERDLARLKKLSITSELKSNFCVESDFCGPISSNVNIQESKNAALTVIAKLKANNVKCGNTVSGKNSFAEMVPYSAPSQENVIKSGVEANKMYTEHDGLLNVERIRRDTQQIDTTHRGDVDVSRVLTPNASNSNKLKIDTTMEIPVLCGLNKREVDLSVPINKRHINRAKLNAVKWVQRNGPIKKENPMSTRGTGHKRVLKAFENDENMAKKQKLEQNEFFSERFKKMMSATSSHVDLLAEKDIEEEDKYFNKLEMKEKMEEKMLSTFKIKCKAVRCLNCKYTNFSASDLCKTQKHILKVFDAVKRFFKCGDCGNRVVCLEVVPIRACTNCGNGKWERTSMMRERKIEHAHTLSIRGGEQKFTNSVQNNANLDLLVPN